MYLHTVFLLGQVAGMITMAVCLRGGRKKKTKKARIELVMKYQIKRSAGQVGFTARLKDAYGPIASTGAQGSNWALSTIAGNPGVLSVDPANSLHVTLDVHEAEGVGTITGQVVSAEGSVYPISIGIEAVADQAIGVDFGPDDVSSVTVVEDTQPTDGAVTQ